MMKRMLTMGFAVALCGGAPLACSPPPQASKVVVARRPLSYKRAFEAPRDATFRATVAALGTFGYTVAFADPQCGLVKTAPKVHRIARLTSPTTGDFAPLSHSFVISVREDGAGNSVVTGYLRTFSAEHETTTLGRPNSPIVEEMWSRLFAEIASDLR